MLPALLLLAPVPGWAQEVIDPAAPSSGTPVTLTLDEAVQIALINNYTLRSNRLDVENANAQIREAWGQVMPQVDVSTSYTRNLLTANPFSGSDAGSLFGSLGFIDWLAYNERARTDDDPDTAPIDFNAFVDRQRQGLQDAGITLGGGNSNPFAVDNQFVNSLSISQTLFDGSAFVGIKGAEQLRALNQTGVDRQEQLLIDQVRQAYYAALLAQEQTKVVSQSVNRTQATLQDVSKRVAQGVAPKFQRLSAEVELANLQTQLLQTQNAADVSLDNLKLTLGIPVEQAVRLRGDLAADDTGQYLTVSIDDAVTTALDHRPDLEQARLAVGLRQIDRSISKTRYLPRLSAFANVSYIGNVPDLRTVTSADPNDPFAFSSRTRGFFSSSYWDASVNAGFRLSWNLFNGFQTSAQVQQRQIAVEKAELDRDLMMQSIRLEVQRAMRNLESARMRILSQEQNVDNAVLNYEHARARLREGVATPLEEREASGLLDQSRFNYLQAVHDYLVARSAFETAVGMPFAKPSDLHLTSN